MYKSQQEIHFLGCYRNVDVWYDIIDKEISLVEVFEGNDDILPDLTLDKRAELLEMVQYSIVMGALPGVIYE